MKKIIYTLIALILLAMGLITFWVHNTLNEKILTPENTYITLKYGTSSDRIIKQFNEIGIFKPSWFFKYYLRYQYSSRKAFISAGTYQIPIEITNSDLIDKLFTRKLLFRNKITIPEGSNLFEIARIISQKMKFDSSEVINLLQNKDFAKKNNVHAKSLEGYLMADTYFFEENQSLEKILNFLIKQQKTYIDLILRDNKTKLDEYQILTLASIIQAETSKLNEMPIVSSVYHNRLKIGLLLQADPTLLYPVFPRKIIYKSDLRKNSPYNTYKNPGLPPTPINCPSKEAIYAAVHPSETNYLYFVLKADNSGSHNFSTNYSEHLQNVRKFKKTRK
ncbi:MAG: hypothetical protein A2X64_10655 [Ignavibacteria bacterium GWF2_33_9]|nr:MAG: hypothetical protein A2X64_10655 [Ignavibacteria bacterium GWF2_33_9]